MSDRVIIVDHLTKNFQVIEKSEGLFSNVQSLISPQKKTLSALKGISFTLGEGECVAIVGPRNAGKTTLLKLLSGMISPTSGLLNVLGYKPEERAPLFEKKVSFYSEHESELKKELTPFALFQFLKIRYKIPTAKFNKTIDELTQSLDVVSILHGRIKNLSMSDQRKIELITKLIHKPQVVLLDEPFGRLDFGARRITERFLKEYYKNTNTTMIIGTSRLDTIINITKRLIILNDGHIVFDGNSDELISEFVAEKYIRIHPAKTIEKKFLESIGKLIQYNEDEIIIATPRAVAPLAAAEILQNSRVDQISLEEPPTDEIISHIIHRSI